MWPTDPEALTAAQAAVVARARGAPPWRPPGGPLLVGGCWVCFPRGLTGAGQAGDAAWVAAVNVRAGRVLARYAESGVAAGPYLPGLMALREGPLLESAVRGLADMPQVLLLDATALDHPRRCGLALHLGAVLDVPTVGVTHRPLLARGDWPDDRDGATAPLTLEGERAGTWLRSRAGTRPLAVHPGWRTDADTAVEVVRAVLQGRRTPEPLRQARHLARRARARATAQTSGSRRGTGPACW